MTTDIAKLLSDSIETMTARTMGDKGWVAVMPTWAAVTILESEPMLLRVIDLGVTVYFANDASCVSNVDMVTAIETARRRRGDRNHIKAKNRKDSGWLLRRVLDELQHAASGTPTTFGFSDHVLA